MKTLILRWNIGESLSYKLSQMAFDMLYYSIAFAKLNFGFLTRTIKFFVCYNNLTSISNEKITEICNIFSVEPIDVSLKLPKRFKNQKIKNSWWKYAISRLDINSYEIVMDNDLIFWNFPPTLKKAIELNALTALQDGVGKFYGDFLKSVENIDSNLKLNAGLLGCPPGFEINLDEVPFKEYSDFFFSEQGYTALQYACFQGNKFLIPISEIQQLNANRIDVNDLINNSSGAHFCGCSYGIETYWDTIYSEAIKNKYEKLVNYESNY